MFSISHFATRARFVFVLYIFCMFVFFVVATALLSKYPQPYLQLHHPTGPSRPASRAEREGAEWRTGDGVEVDGARCMRSVEWGDRRVRVGRRRSGGGGDSGRKLWTSGCG